jgi:hypothetical protein
MHIKFILSQIRIFGFAALLLAFRVNEADVQQILGFSVLSRLSHAGNE